jgi:hypothetical protein
LEIKALLLLGTKIRDDTTDILQDTKGLKQDTKELKQEVSQLRRQMDLLLKLLTQSRNEQNLIMTPAPIANAFQLTLSPPEEANENRKESTATPVASSPSSPSSPHPRSFPARSQSASSNATPLNNENMSQKKSEPARPRSSPRRTIGKGLLASIQNKKTLSSLKKTPIKPKKPHTTTKAHKMIQAVRDASHGTETDSNCSSDSGFSEAENSPDRHK